MTPLPEYYGLLDFMLHEGDWGCQFELVGVKCRIERQSGGAALFEAVAPSFAMALIFPGWYIGEVSSNPVHILMAGDLSECFEWLPVDPDEKRAIIGFLPIRKVRSTVLMLSS